MTATASAVVVQKPLAERIYDRVKDQLGDMVTDDDLRPLIDRAMQDAFFTPRIKKDIYDRIVEHKPPYLVEMIGQAINARVQERVDEWFTTHPEVAAQAIEAVIAKGLLRVTIERLEAKMAEPLYQMTQALRDKGINV